MRPTAIMVLVFTSALIVLMIIWVSPVVGFRNSACERYPLTSGCR